jgi:hypothetical protein
VQKINVAKNYKRIGNFYKMFFFLYNKTAGEIALETGIALRRASL